jgi:hypothetical protein
MRHAKMIVTISGTGGQVGPGLGTLTYLPAVEFALELLIRHFRVILDRGATLTEGSNGHLYLICYTVDEARDDE